MSFPAWEAVTREFVCLPRRSPDIAFSHVYEPPIGERRQRENLYLIGHIEDAAQEERILCNAMILEARKAHYHSVAMSSEERFQKTLQHLNAYIRTYAAQCGVLLHPARFHISILALSGEALMVSETGSVFSYLIRGIQFVEIGKKAVRNAAHSPEGPFTHFVRGNLMKGDIVLAATPHSIQPETLRELEGKPGIPGPLENIEEHLASHTEDGNDEHASAALIMTCVRGSQRTDAFHALSIPSRRAFQEHRAIPPALEKVLRNMFIQRQNEGVKNVLHEKKTRSPRVFWTARSWCMYLLIAGVLSVGGMFSRIVHVNTQTHSRNTFNVFLGKITVTVRDRVHADTSPTQKRMLFAALLRVAQSASDTDSQQTRQVVTQLQGGIRRIDREMIPETPNVLVDFEKLSIVFRPESLAMGSDNAHTIAERGLVQLVRVAPPDITPRLIITGLKASGPIYALSRTREAEVRFAFLEKSALHIIDPRTKTYTQQRIVSASQKLITPDVLFAAGTREFFVISPRGMITRAPLAGHTASLRKVPLPKSLQSTEWRGATVLNSSLYLLTRDMRMLRLSGEKIVSDTPLALAEPLGSTVQLRTLERSKRLAILDGEHKRIILITPDGKLVRQYRHELFADLRDITEREDGKLLILTGTHLLQVSISD